MHECLRRGNFKLLAELKDRRLDFIGYFNRTFAKPFQWKHTDQPIRNESLKHPSTWKEVWASQRLTAMYLDQQIMEDHSLWTPEAGVRQG